MAGLKVDRVGGESGKGGGGGEWEGGRGSSLA